MNKVVKYAAAAIAALPALADTIEKPNIVYVLTDDLGFGDVKCNNPQGKINTPYIDKLASQGMRFTDAHTTSAVCTPTRYSIMTGRYCWRTRLKKAVLFGYSKHLIEDGRTTVGSYLQKEGYDTALIGKWHLGWDWATKGSGNTGEKSAKKSKKKKSKKSKGDSPNRMDVSAGSVDFTKKISHGPDTNGGFDYYFSACGSLDMAPYVYVENGMPTAVPTKTTSRGGYGFWRKGVTAPDFDHEDSTPNYMRRSIAYIKEKAKTPKPFFLYIPLPSPHTPILPTKEWQGKSGINPYADFVMQVDWTLGQIVKAVDEAGIAENTMIVFTSDNGCSPKANIPVLNKKGHDPHPGMRGTKSDVWEGGHRVPFIVRWPKVVKPGQVTDKMTSVVDLLGTVADICGTPLKPGEGEDTESMLPILLGKKEAGRNDLIVHSVDGEFGIRQGDWVYIDCPGSGGWTTKKNVIPLPKNAPPVQLFNLKNDLGQDNNLQGSNPEKAKAMKALLEKHKAQGYTRIPTK